MDPSPAVVVVNVESGAGRKMDGYLDWNDSGIVIRFEEAGTCRNKR